MNDDENDDIDQDMSLGLTKSAVDYLHNNETLNQIVANDAFP